VASRLQLALSDAIMEALAAAAIADVASGTYEFLGSEILPRLKRDTDAGTLPEDPGDIALSSSRKVANSLRRM
jgi:hypothetical protein